MDKTKLIALLWAGLLCTISMAAQDTLPSKPSTRHHLLGIHAPLGKSFGSFQFDINTAFASKSYSDLCRAKNSSIGIHYFYIKDEYFSIGLRASLLRMYIQSEEKLSSKVNNTFTGLLCLRYCTKSKHSGFLIELSGGPQMTTKITVNPSLYDYSSPYTLNAWYRGSIINFKFGGIVGKEDGASRFAYGFETGTTSMVAKRIQFSQPEQITHSWNSKFSGIHLGIFLEFSGLL